MKRTQDVNIRFVESGGWATGIRIRLEKTSLKSRFKRKGRKEEQYSLREEREASKGLAGEDEKKRIRGLAA